MRTWARVAAAAVTVVGGTAIVLVALHDTGLAEDEVPSGAKYTLAGGIAVVLLGTAIAVTWWAAIPAVCVLAAMAVWDWSGYTTDGSEVDGVIAAITLVALGALALVRRKGGGGTPEAPPASAEEPVPPAPSGAPSTPAEEPPRRSRRS